MRDFLHQCDILKFNRIVWDDEIDKAAFASDNKTIILPMRCRNLEPRVFIRQSPAVKTASSTALGLIIAFAFVLLALFGANAATSFRMPEREHVRAVHEYRDRRRRDDTRRVLTLA